MLEFRPRVPRLVAAALWGLSPLISAGHGEAQAGGTSFQPPAAPTHAAAPMAHAVRATAGIAINAELDEAIWSTAKPLTDFTQTDPREGEPVSERTEVRFLYDDEAIYVSAMLYDTAPVTTRLARRDALVGDSDFFVVLLDSYHDHQTAYRFATNPSGMKRDEIVSGSGGPRMMGRGPGDSSWDPIWEVATAVVDSGWVVEMRIPFSQMRYSTADEQVWGIQIERKINRKQETAVFSFTPKTDRGGVARYGHLHGISGIKSGKRLELLPFVGGRVEYVQTEEVPGLGFTNPYRSGSDYFTNAGLDLKYRITSNLTLDATVNPDFGQVELDPADLNLSAFETRFEEKRPFFVEGAEIFNFGEGGPVGSTGRGPQLLYSRRIGRAPQGQIPADAVFANEPSTTTILGAGKVTGRTSNGWSVGLLNAVTGRETAPFTNELGIPGLAEMEPATNYLVGRLRRDYRNGQTRLGMIGSSVNRELSDPFLASRLRSAAYSAGVDFNHEWANRVWRFNSSFSPSYVRGDAGAIARTQRSSVRYYQRPDASHLGLDTLATSLAGYYAMLDLHKQAGTYQAKVALAAASPGYEVNDLGFQTAADRITLDTNFQYEQNRPGRIFRRWDVRGGPDAMWNYDGNQVFADLNVMATWQLANYWGGNARFAFNPETYNDRLTRGGPLSRDPQGYSGHFSFNSDNRKQYTTRANFRGSADRGGSWQRTVGFNLSYKFLGNWQVQAGPDYTRSHVSAQYVATRTDPLADHTFGKRYLFAGLDQTTVSLETRLNVTFTPEISFELYAQPFVSSGDYGALKELSVPRQFAFSTYGQDVGTLARQPDGRYLVDPDGSGPAASFRVADKDFNYRSLHGNAVLRWEWRPGSTVFLVWQQSRAGSMYGRDINPDLYRVGNFELSRDARELFELRPDNIFLIKLNYWLNP